MIVITAIPSPIRPAVCSALLSVIADAWAPEMRGGKYPPLYESPIKFRPETNAGDGFEQWDDPATVLRRGDADCDDLAIWRLAELRARGEKATVSIWYDDQAPTRMHVQIRRANGKIEDPSRIIIEKNGRLPPRPKGPPPPVRI